MSWLTKLFSIGKKAAIDLGHALLNFVKSQPVRDLLNTALGQIVLSAVAAAGKVASGDQAYEVAFANIVKVAESAGIDFTKSTVNLLIEVALQHLKVNAPEELLQQGQGPAGSPPPAA